MGDPLLDSALAEAGWLRRLARSLVRDAHRADDAVQETLATALGERGRRSPRAWLAKVLRNELRQDSRARSRRAFHEQRAARGGSAPSAHEVNERLELQRRLLAAVSALEEPYRATLVARFFDELPPRAIARRDGVPVRTVNTRLERGLAKLRARLDGEFGGGRTEWLQALAPFAGGGAGLPWSALGKGASMGTKAKLAAVGVLALIGVAWFGTEMLEPGARPSVPPTTAHGGASRGAESRHAGSEASKAALAPAALAPADAATEGTDGSRSAIAPTRASETRAASLTDSSAVLAVRVVKRRTNGGSAGASLLVRDASQQDATTLFDGGDGALVKAATDSSGGALLTVPSGRVLQVSVDPGSWEKQSGPGVPRHEFLQRVSVRVDPLAAHERRELVIEIEHGCDRVLEGRVVAAEDGGALAGVLVRPQPLEPYEEPLETDAAGFFALPYASWNPPYVVELRLAGYTPVSLRPQWIDQVQGVPLLVSMDRTAVIQASIDGSALPELTLSSRVATDRTGALATSQHLGGDGRGELEVAARAPLELELRAQGGELLWRSPEAWTLEPGERRELALRLGGGTLVYGYLLDPGRAPVAGTEIWAVHAGTAESVEGKSRYLDDDRAAAFVARTEGDGRFEFAELERGSWWIGPAPRGRWWEQQDETDAPACLGVGVELLPGVASRRVELSAYRGAWIRGRTTDEAGRELSEIEVAGRRSEGQGELRTQSDEHGRFRLGPLAPGMHALRTYGGDGVFGWPTDAVEVEAGAKDVVLVIPSRNSIGGRVVDREGHAVDARVHLLQRNGSLGQGTSSRQPGAFLFIALEPGTYSVQAEAPDGRVAVRSVALRDGERVDDVELTLDEGVRIGVRHDLAENVRCAIWAGDALAADSTVHVGEENFETVPAGPLRVELYSGAGTLAERSLQGEPGRVARVEFVLAR